MGTLTRELWLEKATDILRTERFAPAYQVPPIRVSVGFPKRGKQHAIGQCWSPDNAGDHQHHIFISPVVSDPVAAVGTLAHELVHATVGLRNKHGRTFKQCAEVIGLTGRMTATVPSERFSEWITGVMLPQLGDYPHPTFDPGADREKQSTRLVKVECPQCGCVVRMTRKWLTEAGTPTCACGEMMVEAK